MNQPTEDPAIFIDSFDYPLPDERIAKYPLYQRDASKLLVYNQQKIRESTFSSIANFLPEKSLLVYNKIHSLRLNKEMYVRKSK